MEEPNQQMLEVLRSNKGFLHPERWIDYGLRYGFRRVQADELEECPDCQCQSFDTIGQYVYYSTLVRLQACTRCGLAFSDKRIDSTIIQSHFEQAYKDEAYFVDRRHRIFEQISAYADVAAARGACVMDLGGAKGHLLATLKKRRPDLRFVLNDLSKEACNYAARTYGFRTVCGDVSALHKNSPKFDVIIMSDVIYYDPKLRNLWESLPDLLAENGTVIIRVPNRFHLIRVWQCLARAFDRHANAEMQDRIRFFNPEHLYLFSRRYLLTRLKQLGFVQVTAVPSDVLVSNRADFWHPLYFYLCKLLSTFSHQRLIVTPSVLVIAKYSNRSGEHR